MSVVTHTKECVSRVGLQCDCAITAPTKSALLDECPDCGNSGSIYLAGSVMPCPMCKPDSYNAALYAERLNTGEETE